MGHPDGGPHMKSVALSGRPMPATAPQPAATVFSAPLLPRLAAIITTVALLTTTRFTPAIADCSDYADYFHWVSAAAAPGIPQGVAVAGNYAYLAADSGGLQIVDISDPSAPVIPPSSRKIWRHNQSELSFIIGWLQVRVLQGPPTSPKMQTIYDLMTNSRLFSAVTTHVSWM